ncbi:MAG: hypothetical protein ABW221_04080 [Vicinamibacteria bacterium]
MTPEFVIGAGGRHRNRTFGQLQLRFVVDGTVSALAAIAGRAFICGRSGTAEKDQETALSSAFEATSVPLCLPWAPKNTSAS